MQAVSFSKTLTLHVTSQTPNQRQGACCALWEATHTCRFAALVKKKKEKQQYRNRHNLIGPLRHGSRVFDLIPQMAAREHGIAHDVDLTEIMVPFITYETAFRQNVCHHPAPTHRP